MRTKIAIKAVAVVVGMLFYSLSVAAEFSEIITKTYLLSASESVEDGRRHIMDLVETEASYQVGRVVDRDQTMVMNGQVQESYRVLSSALIESEVLGERLRTTSGRVELTLRVQVTVDSQALRDRVSLLRQDKEKEQRFRQLVELNSRLREELSRYVQDMDSTDAGQVHLIKQQAYQLEADIQSGIDSGRLIFQGGSLANMLTLREVAEADERRRVRNRYRQIWTHYSAKLEPQLEYIESRPDGSVVVYIEIPFPEGLDGALGELFGGVFQYDSENLEAGIADADTRNLMSDRALMLTDMPALLTIEIGSRTVVSPAFGTRSHRGMFARLTMGDTREFRTGTEELDALKIGFVRDEPYGWIPSEGNRFYHDGGGLRLVSKMAKDDLRDIHEISASFSVSDDYF